MRHRLSPDERRKVITDAIKQVASASEGGPLSLTFDNVASACTVPTSRWTVKQYFPTVGDLRSAATGAGA